VQQNIYDDPDFYAKYSEMPRSLGGLDKAGEWPAFQFVLPNLQGKRLLDLGCGFGWHGRYARQQGAQSVIGVDISEKMLAHAAALTHDAAIEYRRTAIEDINFPANTFDVVISSLALHYVERFDLVCRKIQQCLGVGGTFVMSVEHPIFTAVEAQDWHYAANGERLHWPVDNYQQQDLRHTQWLADDVIKYHRTIETYVNSLIDAGFRISRLLEPAPTAEMLNENPDWADECRRPMFLLLAAVRL
jgi:SAM-dependent methyltransferase